MSDYKEQHFSRRKLLKSMGLAPLIFRSAPLWGASFLTDSKDHLPHQAPPFAFSDVRLSPRYPSRSPLADVLRLVDPGSDEYVTEKYAFEIESLLRKWGDGLKASGSSDPALEKLLAPSLDASLLSAHETALRSGSGIEVQRRRFLKVRVSGREKFLAGIQGWLGGVTQVDVAEFQIVGIEEIARAPVTVQLEIRYDLVVRRDVDRREEWIGEWRTEWTQDDSAGWTAHKWDADDETRTVIHGSGFADVSAPAFSGVRSYDEQLMRGVDYWRTVLDGACGIDVYGNNGVAAGDFDNDGFDDLYICQPAGLPNRLYRNRGDGTFEDVTEKSGVGVLDSTACALFADFENKGRQDLLVVCGSGPLLFVNQGDGSFQLKRDAFQFAHPPEGTFTHAALADYDRDGLLDIYLCTYSYYLGLDQYHYPVPYFDARNGPANFLMHNQGNGTFVDRTEAVGLGVDNDRYSFACAWGETVAGSGPDLYVSNDFGRGNLYRNNGGKFTSVAKDAHVEDPGAGMSAAWCDYDNDGREDVYVANMWSSAGQRVSKQKLFQKQAPDEIRALYRRHARGNSLYRNLGDGRFQNVCQESGVEMGRWSWCSDFFDFDQDGYPDIYVANGYISAPEKIRTAQDDLVRNDLGSFFWRQVVGKSPPDSTPSLAYEHGWNALNELIRSDISWSGFERNVLFANNRDGTFSEVSGPVGLDFPEDSRSFALADLDHDGRLEVILKNRNAPQLRVLHNGMKNLGNSIVFRLRGVKSNRDAIGAAITVEAGPVRQTRYLQAGSGFLAQHSKEVLFGVGGVDDTVRATVRWPSGLSQVFEALPVHHRIEIEEGFAEFKAKPFAAVAKSSLPAASRPSAEVLPEQVATWLIEPLKAPEFTLADLSGNQQQLRDFRGRLVLLSFWAMTSTASRDQLKQFERQKAALASSGLVVVSVCIDRGDDVQAARSFAAKESFSFQVLFASEEVAGIYNIIYRYLFDRRRDLGIPSSFLLDKEGKIVRLYQGQVETQRLLEDLKAIPTTAAARMQKAMPLGGALYQGSFQRNDFTYGVALFQHGYLEQAAESFQQVVAAKPDDPEGYYNLGTLNLRRNNYSEARRYLEQTLKLRPNYPEAWNNLGMMAAQQGQVDEAIRSFQESLKLRPGYAIALLNLGNVYRRQGDFAKAEEYLDKALEIQSDDPEINYSLGMLYAQQSQMQRASEFLNKAVDLRPDYPEALNNLGVLFVRGQEYSRAEEQFKTCIRLSPNFDQSYLNLARLYAMRSDKVKARDVLAELLRLQPQNPNAQKAMEMLK